MREGCKKAANVEGGTGNSLWLWANSVLVVLVDYYCLFTYLFTSWLLLLCFHSFPPALQANSEEEQKLFGLCYTPISNYLITHTVRSFLVDTGNLLFSTTHQHGHKKIECLLFVRPSAYLSLSGRSWRALWEQYVNTINKFRWFQDCVNMLES